MNKLFSLIVLVIGLFSGARAEDSKGTILAEAIKYERVPYKKISSPAFVDDYAGKKVRFTAMFLGEETRYVVTYRDSGIGIDGLVFVNHRAVAYKAHETGLGSSDVALSTFPLSIEKNKSDPVFEFERGDIVEVRGIAESAKQLGAKCLHVRIHSITKAGKK